jgi:CBS domain-containing protein
MIQISQIINQKGAKVHTISTDATIHEAAQAMAINGISSLLVLSGDDPVGIIAEHDLVVRLAATARGVFTLPVWQAMHEAHEIDIDDDVVRALELMSQKHVRHLLVSRNGVLAGIVSIGDLVKIRIDEQQGAINNLSHIITASE